MKQLSNNYNLEERTAQFGEKIIKFCKEIKQDAITKSLINQLVRSRTSIGANYMEANSASSKRDFINFFTHSLKSANESKVWLVLLKDTNKGNREESDWLLNELIEIANVLASSIITLKGKNKS